MDLQLINIREMFPDDVPRVLEIERASFSTPWSETSFYSEIYCRHSTTRVAEFEGVIVGYICVRQLADECHLMDLAVHPDYRKQGLATFLFGNILDELKKKECRFLYLEVRASNSAAKDMYEGVGFKTVGLRKRYYLNPEDDAVIMMRQI